MNPNTLRIISIVQARVDAFLKEIFDIYKSSEDDPAMKTPSDAIATKTAICDAIEVVVRSRRNDCSLFSRLDVDVVHSIFGAALDVDLVHDPHFPLENLDRHRHQLFRMRRVSTSWNKFLLSSPRYWRVINIKSEDTVTCASIERSESAPLCLYCITALPQPLSRVRLVLQELRSCFSRVQTLRSDDPDAYITWRVLLRTPTHALRTLKLMGKTLTDSGEDSLPPLGNLSRIRHLTAYSWQPPSDGVWLAGLKELVLARLPRLDQQILLVLSTCSSLEMLSVQCDDDGIEENLSGAPSSISLPYLQTMDLTFESAKPATNLIRRLPIPQCLGASLWITVAIPSLDQYVVDYCRFISPGENCIPYPDAATILIKSLSTGGVRLIYVTDTRRISFDTFRREDALAFRNLVQEFQTLLKKPSLNVTITKPSFCSSTFLKSLWNQNIRAIVARRCAEGSVDVLLSAIGESVVDAITDTPESTAVTWPFESLKSLTIRDTDLNVSQITRLVGIRQQYLRENTKTWLEEIVLVKCRLKGMRLAKAVKQLAAIGVTLRGVECSRM